MDVQQYNIGPAIVCQDDCFPAVRRFSNNVEPGLLLEETSKRSPDDRMVVGEDKTDLAHGSSDAGVPGRYPEEYISSRKQRYSVQTVFRR